MSQEVWDAYYTWFYDSNVWKTTSYRGIRTLKFPPDMWNYQEIIFAHKIDNVIETGTRHGGSALYFADLLSVRNPHGRVYSIDISDEDRILAAHERIHFLLGDSADPVAPQAIANMMGQGRGKVFLILDSDHSCDHVYKELECWVPFLQSGDYLVVEDSCVNGHPVRKDHGPGPYEAVEKFVLKYPDLLKRDLMREQRFGPTASPNGFFIKN